MNTDGVGKPFSGVGEGSWEAGSVDYKDLPRAGATVHVDQRLVASWSYDKRTRELITYDTVEVGEMKADWIDRNHLGGYMTWSIDADYPAGHPQAFMERVSRRLGQLERSENHLRYPGSKWDNLRAGM